MRMKKNEILKRRVKVGKKEKDEEGQRMKVNETLKKK